MQRAVVGVSLLGSLAQHVSATIAARATADLNGSGDLEGSGTVDASVDSGLLAMREYLQLPGLLLPVPCREHLPDLFAAMGLTGNAAEVGVLRGEFSKRILSSWSGHLYLVDPWEHQSSGYVDMNNVEGQAQDDNYRQMMANVAEFGVPAEDFPPALTGDRPSRVHVLKAYSVEAAAAFPDSFFDWVYLDGDHRYEAVRDDIAAWWPKVAAGGVLAGHDFVQDGMHPAGLFGVRRAVLEFAARSRKQVVTTSADGGHVVDAKSTVCRTEAVSWNIRK